MLRKLVSIHEAAETLGVSAQSYARHRRPEHARDTEEPAPFTLDCR